VSGVASSDAAQAVTVSRSWRSGLRRIAHARAGPAGERAPAAPEPIRGPAAIELALFSMADELDLPARRVRDSLMRLLRRLREVNVTLEVAQRQLEEWIAAGP